MTALTPERRAELRAICQNNGTWYAEPMLALLDALEAAEAESRRLREIAIPEPTCPAIDRVIAERPELAGVLEGIRHDNCQLRYGLWHEQTRAATAETRAKAAEAVVDAMRKLLGPPSGFGIKSFRKVLDAYDKERPADAD